MLPLFGVNSTKWPEHDLSPMLVPPTAAWFVANLIEYDPLAPIHTFQCDTGWGIVIPAKAVCLFSPDPGRIPRIGNRARIAAQRRNGLAHAVVSWESRARCWQWSRAAAARSRRGETLEVRGLPRV